MLGEMIGEVRGKITGNRVLPSEGHAPKVETFEEIRSKIKLNESSPMKAAG